jgi:hypothetical protein
MTTRLLIALTATVFIAAVACDDGGEERVEINTPSGVTPTSPLIDIDTIGEPLAVIPIRDNSPFSLFGPSDSPELEVDAETIAACEAAIADVQGYRYRNELTIEFTNAERALEQIKQLEIDALVALGTPEAQASQEVETRTTSGPYSTMFGGPIAQDFEGSFEAPESWRATPGPDEDLDGEADYEEIIVIGENAWAKKSGVWNAIAPEDADLYESGASPIASGDTYCQDTAEFLQIVDGITPEAEEIDGIRVDHYHLSVDDVNRFTVESATPESGELVPVFSEAEMDIWYAPETYQVMKMTFSGEIEATEESGVFGELFPSMGLAMDLSYEIFDINDRSISIEPPI